MVLFGGFGSQAVSGDTWEFDGSRWTKVSDTGPNARGAFGMAYDSARGRTVVFGGGGDVGDPIRTDTWEWDGSTWTQVATAGPPGNVFHTMAYDARRQRVVSFGGRGGRGETWEWDGRTWTKVATSGPAPRDHHSMTYDSKRGVVIVLGGGGQPNGVNGYTSQNPWTDDFWAWDGQTWTKLGDAPVSRGSKRAFAYDARRDRLVLLIDATWEWDGTRWSRVSR